MDFYIQEFITASFINLYYYLIVLTIYQLLYHPNLTKLMHTVLNLGVY